MHYVFKADSINKMKYCPFCGSEMISVYDGDYSGQVECLNCDECENELEFEILEEMLVRLPAWIKTFMKKEAIELEIQQPSLFEYEKTIKSKVVKAGFFEPTLGDDFGETPWDDLEDDPDI